MAKIVVYVLPTFALLVSCIQPAKRQICSNDSACGSGFRCNQQSGVCERRCDNPRFSGINCDECRFDGALTPTCIVCGDGIVDTDAGEICDDGNRSNDDGCDSNCTLTSCGNGILNEGEECDDGNRVVEFCPYEVGDCVVCGAACTEIPGLISRCGDGIIDIDNGEECDDGNQDNDDGCLVDCREASPILCSVECDSVGTTKQATRSIQVIPNDAPAGSRVVSVDVLNGVIAIGSRGAGYYNCLGGLGRLNDRCSDLMLGEVNLYGTAGENIWVHRDRLISDNHVYFGNELVLGKDTLAITAVDPPNDLWNEPEFMGLDQFNGPLSGFFYRRTGLDEWSVHEHFEHYGGALAASGHTFLVGSSLDVSIPTLDPTCASGIYPQTIAYRSDGVREGIVQEGHLAPELIQQCQSALGQDVAFDGHHALIGAPVGSHGCRVGCQHETGVVHVVRRLVNTNEWQYVQRLEPVDSASVKFGFSTAIYGDTALVAVKQRDDPASQSVLVFRHSNGTWIQTQRLVGPANSGFGDKLAISENIVLISAPNERQNLSDVADTFCDEDTENSDQDMCPVGQGVVYVFTRRMSDRWEESEKNLGTYNL